MWSQLARQHDGNALKHFAAPNWQLFPTVATLSSTHVKISHLVDKMMAEEACSKLLTSCNKLVNLSSCNKLVNKLVTTC